MAISRIKKLEVIGLEKDEPELLSLLQKLGIAQLIEIKEEAAIPPTQIAGLQATLSEIQEAISFLDTFKAETGALGGVVKFKPIVYEKQLQEVMLSFDYKNLLQELSHLRNHFKNTTHHRERLIQERHLLFPWRSLRLSLEEIYYKQHCGVILGILNTRDYPVLARDIAGKNINTFVEIPEQDQTNTHLVIFYIQEDFERLEACLKQHHFNFVTLPRQDCSVKDRLFQINGEILFLDDRLKDLNDNFISLLKQQFKLMVVYDYLNNVRNTQEADKILAKQQFTFLLRAWIRQKDQRALEREISLRFKDVALFISDPAEEENIPVILENKPLLEPFEFITGIYGMPKYNELDPTPYLAPFFFLYFGFCVSDAGYGFMLIALCSFILKKFHLGPQGIKFFKLFLYCGISTVIIGILTGSWFGNLPDILAQSHRMFLPLKKLKDSLIILDPLQQPTKLLGIALSFGIAQIWFGNIVAAVGNIKNKRYLDILFDQVTTLTLLFGLTGFGLIFLKLMDAKNINLFKYAILAGAVGLILTQGRSEKGMGAKLFYGAYNLYNSLSGYLSDVLSYSRLWALGLVTGVMAGTVNLISIQFAQISVSLMPFLNKIIMLKFLFGGIVLVVIFVCGHMISFLMNLLGAFVHPVRLQFVEFFSKFFKSGGSAFRPFRVETKYIKIE
jgi:V/A-type H+-transporting ATPase subunit I